MSTAYDKVMTSRKQLVDKVIRMMQEGYHKNAAKWNRAALRPHNPESGAVYRGGNRLKLMVAAMEQGYEDPRWMTFKQMQGAGYQLKRGQHGVLCEKWIFTERKKQLNEKGEEELVEAPLDKPKVAYFYVYNAQQIENYPELMKNELDPDLLTLAEQLKESSECPVYEMAQDRAFYNRNGDYICLPLRAYFKDAQSFASTLIHEMGHSTGHESRLGRKFGTTFGDPDYAREELRAELGALFLEADLGLESGGEILEDHSDYLKSWIGALRDDPNELFRACADADKISARLMENYRKQLEKEMKKEEEERLQEEPVKTDQEIKADMEPVVHVVWSEHPDPPEFAKISFKVQEKQEIHAYKEMVEQEIQQEAASYGMTVEEYAANDYEPPAGNSKEVAESPDPDAVQIEKALQNRENTDHGIYHDVGAALEQFTTAQLINYYLSQGNDQLLRSYLEEQITQNEISKNRERAMEKLGLKGEEQKGFDKQSNSGYLRRYRVDAEGNAYRTFNGKRPEEFSQEETLLFMANTDLMMYGSLSEDMQKLLKSEGYMYANGKLEKLQAEKEVPKQTFKRIIK